MNWVSVDDGLPTISKSLQMEGYVQVKVAVWTGFDWCEAWYEPEKRAFFDSPGWLGKEISGVTHWATVKSPERTDNSGNEEIEFGRIMTIGGRMYLFWSSNRDGKFDRSQILSEDKEKAIKEAKELLGKIKTGPI
jgi:hypothetical protein